MANFQTVTIGDVCDIEKGQTGIQSATPGDYPLVTTAQERKSADTYQFDTAAVCIPLVSSTGHGKKSLNYVHYQNGKFALGTILAAVIPKDPEQLSAAFLQQYLQFYKDTKIVPFMKGAANVSLSMRDIAKIEIPLPPIEEQIEFIDLFNRASVFSEQLIEEFDQQLDYIIQLRQTILQEAIEGKLTAGWRADHPVQPGDPATDAAALLAQIQAEKAQLVAEKKIKKQKPLPPITEAEMPFALPAGWVWCRLGEITLFSEAGKSYRCEQREVKNQEWGVVKVSSVSWGRFLENENKFYRNDVPSNIDAEIKQGDFLISRANTRELVGRSVVVENITKNLLLSDKTIRYKFTRDDIKLFVRLCTDTQTARDHFEERATGASPSMKNITRNDMNTLTIPLPPLAEQRAIVERVERLLALVDELAAQVAARKAQADALMQAVLREAFAGE